jgi:hypothetical protein
MVYVHNILRQKLSNVYFQLFRYSYVDVAFIVWPFITIILIIYRAQYRGRCLTLKILLSKYTIQKSIIVYYYPSLFMPFSLISFRASLDLGWLHPVSNLHGDQTLAGTLRPHDKTATVYGGQRLVEWQGRGRDEARGTQRGTPGIIWYATYYRTKTRTKYIMLFKISIKVLHIIILPLWSTKACNIIILPLFLLSHHTYYPQHRILFDLRICDVITTQHRILFDLRIVDVITTYKYWSFT